MATIDILNVKVQIDPEALDLLQAVKDAVAAIESQCFCGGDCYKPSVTVVNNFFEASGG